MVKRTFSVGLMAAPGTDTILGLSLFGAEFINAHRSQYHGFVVKRTFSMGLMAAPGTDTILGRLGGDGADQVLSLTRQGYLAHKKTPTSLGLSKDPRHRPTAGS